MLDGKDLHVPFRKRFLSWKKCPFCGCIDLVRHLLLSRFAIFERAFARIKNGWFMINGFRIRGLWCLLGLPILLACTTESDSASRTPASSAPTLSGLSLVRYFFYRYGGSSIDTVPLSPKFNPTLLDYSADSQRGPIAVIPKFQSPDSKVTVTLNDAPTPIILLPGPDTGFSGYVGPDNPGNFSVIVRDTLKDLETTYRIMVKGL